MRGTGQSENKLSNKMTFSDHLEELRQRILNSICSILISILFSFIIIKPLISFLEIPAGDIHLLQLAPGEFLFVAIKVACLLYTSPSPRDSTLSRMPSSA